METDGVGGKKEKGTLIRIKESVFVRTPESKKAVIWAWIAFNLIDFMLTVTSINLAEVSEGNPIIGKFVDDPLSLFLYKFVLTFAVLGILTKFNQWNILFLCTVGMGLVCIWNVIAVIITLF